MFHARVTVSAVCLAVVFFLASPATAIIVPDDSITGDLKPTISFEITPADPLLDQYFAGQVVYSCQGQGTIGLDVSVDLPQDEINRHVPAGASIVPGSVQITRFYQENEGSWQLMGPTASSAFTCPPDGEGMMNNFTFSVDVLLQFSWTKTVGEKVTSGTVSVEGSTFVYAFVYKRRSITASAAETLWVTVNDITTEIVGNMVMGTKVPAVGVPVAVKDLPAGVILQPSEGQTSSEGIAVFNVYLEPESFAAAGVAALGKGEVANGTLKLDLNVEIDAKDTLKTTSTRYCARIEGVEGTVWVTQPLSPTPEQAVPGMNLVPGARISGERQVGPLGTVYPFVSLSFANGATVQDFRLADDKGGQPVIEISYGSAFIAGQKATIMDIWLDKLEYNIMYQPRELIGGILDTVGGAAVSGISAGYGFVVKTVAGQLAKFGLRTIRSQGSQANQGQDDPARAAGLLYPRAATAPAGGPGLAASVSLQENGTLKLTSRGRSLAITDESGTTRLVPGGTSRVLDVIGGTGTAGAVPLSPPQGTLNAGLTLSPANNAVVNSRTPLLSVSHPISGIDLVDPPNCQMWVNGINVTQFVGGNWQSHAYQVPATRPLLEGQNTLDVRVVTRAGRVLTAKSVFTAHGAPPAPEFLEALPGSTAIGLRWADSDAPDVATYVVERAASAQGPWTTLGQTPQPAYLDASPLDAAAFYRVKAVNTANVSSAWSNTLQTAKSGMAPPAPVQAANVTASNVDGRLEIALSPPGSATLGFLIERGPADTGPFTSCLPEGVILGRGGFVDATCQTGVPYHFRLTPLDRNGQPGAPTVHGPYTLAQVPPPPPEGISAVMVGNSALVRWDPSPFAGVSGYRVYRWTEAVGWTLVNAGAPLVTTSFSEAVPRNSVRLYAVAAQGPGGTGTMSEPAEANSYAATAPPVVPPLRLLLQ